MKTYAFIRAGLTLWASFCFVLAVKAQPTSPKQTDLQTAAKAAFSKVDQVVTDGRHAVPRAVSGDLAIGVSLTDAAQAKAFLRQQGNLFRIDETHDDFTVQRLRTDALGISHLKLRQTYKSVPVYGAELITHTTSSGTLRQINGRFIPDLTLDTQPTIPATQAFKIALQDFGTVKFLNPPTPTLWIAPENGDFENGAYRLVWRLTLVANLKGYEYFIDAKTGAVIHKVSAVHAENVTATGLSNYNGEVQFQTNPFGGSYQMHDTGRKIKTYNRTTGGGGGGEDPSLGGIVQDTGCSSCPPVSFLGSIVTDVDNYWTDKNAVDVHWGLTQTFDFYQAVFGRNSINNAGAEIKALSSYNGQEYGNAFWYPDSLWAVFGTGGGISPFSSVSSLDVCAHELTHGVTQFEAGLIYQAESGALNEAFSDIFGTAVEFYATPAKANWLIAEDCWTPGTAGDALRYMNNPNLANHPDTYRGTHWASTTASFDNGGVHINSGVLNYAFYLMSVGGSGTNDKGFNYAVSGITIGKAQRIAYRALTEYLFPSAQYSDARVAFLASASDLYGYGSAEWLTVRDAFDAVGVGIILSAKNNFEAGTLKFNGTTRSSGASLITGLGESATLEAVEQPYGGYDRVWHAGIISQSSWTRTLPSGEVQQASQNISHTFSANVLDSAATYTAGLRRRYNITRNDDADVGSLGSSVALQVVESNTGTLTAPNPLIQGSNQYHFLNWDDGLTSNSRAVTPTDNQSFTAKYKGKLLSSLSTATEGSGQRRLVKDRQANRLYLVYESAGQIWLTISTDNGATWQNEMLIGSGKNPSAAEYDNGVMLFYVVPREVTGLSYDIIRVAFYAPDAGGIFRIFQKTLIGSNDLRDSRPVGFGRVSNTIDAAVIYEAKTAANAVKLRVSYFQSASGTPEGGSFYSTSDVPGTTSGIHLNPALDFVRLTSGSSEAKLIWNGDPNNSSAPLKTCIVGLYPAVFSSGADLPVQGSPTVSYQRPTIVTDANNYHRYLACEAYDHTRGKSVVMYKYFPGYGDPTSPWTEFVSGSQSYEQYSKPSIHRESNGAVSVFYRSSYNAVLQSRTTTGGSSWQFVSNFLGYGGSPNALLRDDSRRFVYTQGSVPAQLTFGYGSNGLTEAPRETSASASDNRGDISQTATALADNDASKVSFSSSGSSTANSFTAQDEPPMINQATAVSLSESDAAGISTALLMVELEKVSAGSVSVGAQLLPDTLAVTSQNIFSLLRSNPVTITDSTSLLTASVSVRVKNLSRFGNAVKVWVEWFNTSTHNVLASSPRTTLSAADSMTVITANFNAASAGLTNQSVAMRVRIQGVRIKPAQTLAATNLLFIGTPENQSAVVVSTAPANASRTVASAKIPTAFELSQNYPNPFNPSTTIRYALPQSAKVSVRIYDMLGRAVSELVNETKPAGYYEARFDASRLSSGTYFYRLTATGSAGSQGSFVETKKMVLVK